MGLQDGEQREKGIEDQQFEINIMNMIRALLKKKVDKMQEQMSNKYKQRDVNSKKESKWNAKDQKQYHKRMPLMGSLVDETGLRKESLRLRMSTEISQTEKQRERKKEKHWTKQDKI